MLDGSIHVLQYNDLHVDTGLILDGVIHIRHYVIHQDIGTNIGCVFLAYHIKKFENFAGDRNSYPIQG